ncbi:MAG: Flp family type IVb pilin [Desulfobaccales bacterium]|jgi:pilus assembly protein Flp/PilA
MERVTRFFRDESGTSAVEYGLMFALITIFVLTAVSMLGTSLNDLFVNAGNQVSVAAS